MVKTDDQPDRARPRAVVAADRPHRPIAVHCSSGRLAQPVRIHSGTWALRKELVHIRSRTWVLRTGLVHSRSGSWARRRRLVRRHNHNRALRTRLLHIHSHRGDLCTQLLHWSAREASRKPARLQHQCRRRRAPHKRTAPQHSQCTSMTMLLLLQQQQVVGSSCYHSLTRALPIQYFIIAYGCLKRKCGSVSACINFVPN